MRWQRVRFVAESESRASTNWNWTEREALYVKQSTPKASLRNLLRQVHADQRGQVSIETVLILAAIALPILIFVIKFGWPRIKGFFEKGMTELEGESNGVGAGGGNGTGIIP